MSWLRFAVPGVALLALSACSGSSGAVPTPTTVSGPMNGVEVVVGGTSDPTEQIMSAFIVLGLQDQGALVVDRSNTDGPALNRDDLVAGRLQIVPEDIGTGWFIHLGQTTDFERVSELAAELRRRDRANGIEWSEPSGFDDALVAIAEPDGATDSDGEPISMDRLAQRLRQSFDAVVCVDSDTLQSPDGLVRFERATGYTVPAEQLQTRPTDGLIDDVASGECTVAFVPGTDPAIGDADLVAIDRFAPEGLPRIVFIPRNAAYMVESDFYGDWAPWLDPFIESLMATLDTETMVALKDDLAGGDAAAEIARRHLERNDLL